MRRLTGTLWVVRDRSTKSWFISAGVDVWAVPASPYTVRDNPLLASLPPGTVVLISGEPVGAANNDTHRNHQKWVPVASPQVGYMNETYFTRDSMWMERIG